MGCPEIPLRRRAEQDALDALSDDLMSRRSILLTMIGQSPSKALLGLAFIGFLAFSPTPVNAQSKGGCADRVESYDSDPSQKAGSRDDVQLTQLVVVS